MPSRRLFCWHHLELAARIESKILYPLADFIPNRLSAFLETVAIP
jgi:hypothetical protein